MDPFSISCTTCRAQLSVTSSKALGQILACPKCQSMVLVPDAPPSAEAQLADAIETSQVTSGGLSDSFENIDSLLDGPAPGEASTSADRWRAPEAAAHEHPVDVDPSGHLADGTVSPAASTLLLRKYFLIAGSVVFGTLAAVGVIVISTNRGEDDVNVSRVKDDPPSPVVASPPKDNTENHASAPNVIETQPEDATPKDSEPPTPSGAVTTISPDDHNNGINQEVAPTPNTPTDDVVLPDTDTPQTVVDTAEDLNAFSNEPDRPSPEPTIGQDDELTDFVEWLKQDPRSAAVSEATAPVPASEQPAENTIEPIPSTNRPEPALVNVDARLRDPVNGISFSKTALSRSLRAIQSVSTIPITVEPDALYLAKTTAKSKISFIAKEKQTVDDLLTGILKKASKGRLAIEIDSGHLTVTAKSMTKYSPSPHKIDDLVVAPQSAEELATWIPHLIAPGTWQADGGRATCEGSPKTNEMVVTHNLLNQYRVYRFLHRLRAARGLPYKKLSNGQTSLEPRPTRIATLQTTVSVRLPRGATLPQIVNELQRQTSIGILVDWKSLHAAGWSPKDELSFFCDNIPLGLALDQLLTPIGLAANVVDDATLQIIYPLSDPSWDIEFYELTNGTNEQAAADTVARVANGTGIPAASVWDQASKRLIVAAPQSVHRRLLEEFK